MDLKDIPEQYGGTLKWNWGDDPDLDAETREALERDGHKGWVRGPALWLEKRRVVVGTQDGKLRRSVQEIAAMKPITYAADYTEEPVHKETQRRSVSSHKKPMVVHQTESNQPNTGSAQEPRVSHEKAALPAIVAAPENVTSEPTTSTRFEETPDQSVASQQRIPDHIPSDAVRQSPMGDARVYLPDAQAAPPAQTAEYILPSQAPRTTQQSLPPIASKTMTPSPGPRTTPQTKEVERTDRASMESTPHVNSYPASDIPSVYTVQMQRKVADKLAGESIVMLPADSSHPQVILASDTSKGLAIETNRKGSKEGPTAKSTRPVPERFVTAAEF